MVKKIFTILLALLLLQSCSWITDFYVLNTAKYPIIITFKQPKGPETTPYLEKLKTENPQLYKKLKPKPCPFERDIENGKYPEVCDENIENCRMLSPEEYKFNKEGCSIELTLESNKTVKVFTICCSYERNDDEDEKKEKTASSSSQNEDNSNDTFELEIQSSSGLTKYKGIGFLRAFKKIDKTKYVLRYEEEKR